MKILNKELQSNLKEVCKLIQLNAKNKSKKKNFVFSVSVHDTFFVADILEFVNDESRNIGCYRFYEFDGIEKRMALINGIKTTLGL